MLRTCNALRIAHFPVLRKDGALRRDGGRWTWDGGRRTVDGGRGTWGRTGVLGLDCFARLAMTVRRDGGRGYVRARRGETTPPLRGTPPKRGIYGGGRV
ncbi:MAG: hypothetical protein LBM98_10655 [Oscillospiraceae bacterium]|nr:hypothetical protein [Oscillospiraceae bacterium]